MRESKIRKKKARFLFNKTFIRSKNVTWRLDLQLWYQCYFSTTRMQRINATPVRMLLQ